MRQKITFLLLLCLSVGFIASAQTMRIGVRPGSSPNSVILTLQPNFNFNNKLNELGFVIMVPKESPPGTPIPMPSIEVLNCPTCLATTFPAASWAQIQDAVSDPNYYLLRLGCVSNLVSAPTLNIANGAQQDAIELRFYNSTATPSEIRLAHLAAGGPGTQYGASLLDGLSNDLLNYVQMFYGAGVVPVGPHPDDVTGYNNTQYVPLASVVLPISWLTFQATKHGNDALLDWTVANEETNLKYEIQRSLNGIDYTTIGFVNKMGTGSGTRAYDYTDAGINVLGASVIYYRLRQISVDGRSSLSDVRTVKLGRGNGEITVYPNPVVDGFYVNVPIDNAGNSIVKLSLLNLSGQVVKTKEITAMQASNYYFDIKGMSLAAGQYNLQIVHDGKLLANKKLLINK